MNNQLLRHQRSDYAFYLHCFIYLFLVFLVLNFNDIYHSMDHEEGLFEWSGEIALMVTSAILFYTTKKYKDITGKKDFKFWMFLFASIAFFWAAGEELSWGQHMFGTETPEWLAKINGQQETNVHNINKKFFDRTLERLTVGLTLITLFQHVRGKQSFLGFRLPEWPLNLAFLLIPIYRKLQDLELDVWHMGFVAFFAYPILAIVKKNTRMLVYSLMFIITATVVAYFHHYNLAAFLGKSNIYHEIRESIFSILCVFFALQLLDDVKKGVSIP